MLYDHSAKANSPRFKKPKNNEKTSKRGGKIRLVFYIKNVKNIIKKMSKNERKITVKKSKNRGQIF